MLRYLPRNRLKISFRIVKLINKLRNNVEESRVSHDCSRTFPRKSYAIPHVAQCFINLHYTLSVLRVTYAIYINGPTHSSPLQPTGYFSSTNTTFPNPIYSLSSRINFFLFVPLHFISVSNSSVYIIFSLFTKLAHKQMTFHFSLSSPMGHS